MGPNLALTFEKKMSLSLCYFASISRLFSNKCYKCLMRFDKNDFVMRAKNRIYHQDCFRCATCDKRLVPGDEFSLRHEEIYCREDSFDVGGSNNKKDNSGGNSIENNNTIMHHNTSNSSEDNSEGKKKGTFRLCESIMCY